MKRRDLLRSLALGLSATALAPTWLPGAFAADGKRRGGRGTPAGKLRAALELAREQGKLLVVLVVPDDEDERIRRGEVLGEMLAWAEDDTLTALSLCHLVCARTATIRTVLPRSRSTPLGILMVADPTLHPPFVVTLVEEPVLDPAKLPRGTNAVVRRAYAHGDALTEIVSTNTESLRRRAKQCRAELERRELAKLERALEDPHRLTPDQVDRAAPLIALRAIDDRMNRDQLRRSLRDAASRRLHWKAPQGSGWATSPSTRPRVGGCGLAPCGTAMIPPSSQRFLRFYVSR